jgi:hypothetical protein
LVASRIDIVRRIVWPARGSLFALVGGAVALFGDLVNFFAEFLTAGWLVAVFALVGIGTGLLCLQRAFLVDAENEDAVDHVVRCLPCDAFRFALFATAVFLLLMLVGRGQSATEVIGERLGLIQRDVAETRRGVEDLIEIAQPQAIIDSPRSAADHFSNAWVYQNMRRDSAGAYREMQALYALGPAGRMDAAQLYFDSGTAVRGRAPVLAEMQALGRRLNDATLLVVAARTAENAAAGEAMMEEARRIDPNLPFAWWDYMRPDFATATATGFDRASQRAHQQRLREALDRIARFRRLYAAHPPSRWFFLPQHAGDPEASARMITESYERLLGTLEDVTSGRMRQRIRDDLRKGG